MRKFPPSFSEVSKMDDTYIVYIRIDGQSRVLEINSSALLADTAGWTQLDEARGRAMLGRLLRELDGKELINNK